MHARAIAIGLAAAALVGAAHARAAVPDTELRVVATAGGETESHELTGASVSSADVDFSAYSPDGDGYTATAHALAGGGGGSLANPPVADCEANVSVTGDATGSASADAYFVHYVKVNGAPPSEVAIYNPPVLARVLYHGETSLEGDIAQSSSPGLIPSAAAYFSIFDGYPSPPGAELLREQAGSTFQQRTDEFDGPGSFTVTIPAALLPYPMEVGIRCILSFAVIGAGSAHGRATADPIFAFDQQAFDEYAAFAGFPTFPLAEHYGFEYSESLVPEPACGAEAVAVLALFSVAARRRRAA